MTGIARETARRAILELLTDLGGVNNDMEIADTLARVGHRITRREVVADLQFLADNGLVEIKETEIFVLADVTAHGRDVAAGRSTIIGVSKFRIGS